MPALVTNILIHWGVELVGGATFACVAWGCKNASHRHGRIVGFVAHRRWARYLLTVSAALASSTATVLIVG